MNSLRSSRRPLRSQDIFLNFAGCSFGQLFDQRHTVRRLKVREIRTRKLANFFELVYSNGFNSPSMVGINSVTVG